MPTAMQGQHLVAAGGLAWDGELNAILDAANRDAGMKQAGLGGSSRRGC